MKIKRRKIKHKSRKNMGFADEGYLRLMGRHGKKRFYGHYCEYSDVRTKAEIKNADDLREEIETPE